jgi:hypothetical protein
MLILYIEELKAFGHSRFAWLGAALILLGIGGWLLSVLKIPGSMGTGSSPTA